MAKVPYAVISPKELKQMAASLGLATHGDRAQLEWRHKEYVLRYNADCDAIRPKSRAELAKEVEAAERARNQDRQARIAALSSSSNSGSSGSSSSGGGHGALADDGASRGDLEYIAAHGKHFDSLVAAARGIKKRDDHVDEPTVENEPKENGHVEEEGHADGDVSSQDVSQEPVSSPGRPKRARKEVHVADDHVIDMDEEWQPEKRRTRRAARG